MTFDVAGDIATIHVNGVAEPTIAIDGGSITNTLTARLGKRENTNYMDGGIDEVRIATVARTTDWILTEYNNQNDPDAFYDVSVEYEVDEICGVLPVELLNFEPYLFQNQVNIDWQTASEINNDYFTIERSVNGVEWEAIKSINGAGNSTGLLSYTAIDKEPYQGISYYRLKQTDFDGQFEYSQIRSVDINSLGNTSIKLYPNPFSNQITIEGSVAELEGIIIYNILGENVTIRTKRTVTNEIKSVIDLSQLKSGVYYIKTKNTSNKIYKL